MKRFKEFLAEAGLKKALKTKKQKLLKKEEQKAEARWERTMDRAMSADVAGAMQEYGASSPEAGRAKLRSDLAHESAGKLASNIEKLKKARKESNVSENYDVYLDMPKDEEEEKEEFQKTAADYLNANSQYNAYNSGWQTDMYLASMLTPKNTVNRMEAEKIANSDIGLGFDVDATTGEIYGSPEGFKAVTNRTKEKRNFPTVQQPIDLKKYKQELLYNLTFGLMGNP